MHGKSCYDNKGNNSSEYNPSCITHIKSGVTFQLLDRIGVAMVSMFASTSTERYFEPRSNPAKHFYHRHLLLLRLAYNIKKKPDWLWGGCVKIICPSGAACLPAAGCYSDLQRSNLAMRSGGKRTSSSFHRNVTYFRHDIAEKCLTWCLTTIAHSLKYTVELI